MSLQTSVPPREVLLATFRNLNEDNVNVFSTRDLNAAVGSNFKYHCRIIFGSWEDAIAAAGIERPKNLEWTPERVLDELKKLHGEGVGLMPGDIYKVKGAIFGRTLVSYSTRFWGGFHKAVEKAGLIVEGDVAKEEAAYHEKRNDLIRKIKDLHSSGVNVSSRTDLFTATGAHSVYLQSRALFTTLQDALKAAGIEPQKRPNRTTARQWTAQEVVQELQSLSALGVRLSPSVIEPKVPGLYKQTQVFFGSFENACAQAGLSAEFMEGGREAYWTREVIKKELSRALSEGRELNVRGLGQDLFHAAGYVYGDLNRALFDAEIYEDIDNSRNIGRAQNRVFSGVASVMLREIYPSIRLRAKFERKGVKKLFDAYLPEEDLYFDFSLLGNNVYSKAIGRVIEADGNVVILTGKQEGSTKGYGTQSIGKYIDKLPEGHKAFMADICSYLEGESETEAVERGRYIREFEYLLSEVSSVEELKEELSVHPLLMKKVRQVVGRKKKLAALQEQDEGMENVAVTSKQQRRKIK